MDISPDVINIYILFFERIIKRIVESRNGINGKNVFFPSKF